MSKFLETYGVAIFALVLISILIAFAGPLDLKLKTATMDQLSNINSIADERIQNPDRPKEPKEALDYVYVCLYNNGELVMSAEEIQNKENVLKDYGKVNTYLVNNEYQEWHDNASKVKSVRFETAIKPRCCNAWFADMINLKEIKNLEYLYTNECTNMYTMFWNCLNLKEINLTNFDTSKVRNVSYMFYKCSSLINMNLQSFNTSNIEDISGMFCGCTNLTELNLCNFNTSKCTNMRDMFGNCSNLKKIDLSSFNTTNVTDMWHMFCGCNNLLTLDLSNFNTSKVTNTNHMFAYCNNLNILKFSNSNLNNVSDMTGMFWQCNVQSITTTQAVKDKILSLIGNISSNPTWNIVK